MTERCSGRYGTNQRCGFIKGHRGDCGPWAPKPPAKRTRLAIDLQAQAAMLQRFGFYGLDCLKLAALLRDAAKALDSLVEPLEIPKAAK